MQSNINLPRLNPRELSISVAKGGTSALTVEGAIVNLQLSRLTDRDTEDQPVGLNGSTKISSSLVPVPAGYKKVSIEGPAGVVISSSEIYTITDFDSNREYVTTVSSGSVTRSGDTVTVTAPGSTGTLTLTINGNEYNISILTARPKTPTLTAPLDGAVDISASTVFTTSAYVALGDSNLTHQSSDWEIATDPDFTNIVHSTVNDTVNKTSWTPGLVVSYTRHYARVRHRNSASTVTDWSPVVSFTTVLNLSTGAEEAKISPADRAASNFFGFALDIDTTGTRVVASSYNAAVSGQSSAGAVYIFTRTGSSWAQEAKINAPVPSLNGRFGYDTAIDATGSRVVVGEYGVNKAYVFSRAGTIWSWEATLTAADPSVATAQYGAATDISADGNRVIVGRNNSNETLGVGSAYIYVRSGTTWTQEAKFIVDVVAGSPNFGSFVKLDDDATRCLVGTYSASAENGVPLFLHVFVRSGTTWTREAKLQGAGATKDDFFCWNVDIDSGGTRVYVGAQYWEGGFSNQGAVYIFVRSGTTWTQEARLTASDPITNGRFGRSVAINKSSTKLVVGSNRPGTGFFNQRYTFTRNGSAWTEIGKAKTSDGVAADLATYDISQARESTRVAVGAPNATVSGVTNAGAVYIFA